MKLTWREQADGSWLARFYPQGKGPLPAPFILTVTPQVVIDYDPQRAWPPADMWRWRVRRDDFSTGGSGPTPAESRIRAHFRLVQALKE